MLTKSKVIETIQEFDDNFSLDYLFEKICFIDKVEEGLQDSKEGRITSQEDLKKEMQQWFK